MDLVERVDTEEKKLDGNKKYAPQYKKVDDYLNSMRCACACSPGGPGPYCGPGGPPQPPKCSRKIDY